MTLKPGVLVYQEDAAVATPDTTATLNALIAGPAYHIQDYGVDDADIQLTSYGTLVGYTDPALPGNALGVPSPGTDAITVAEPPNNVVGATLDHSSVVVHAENLTVQVLARAASGGYGTTAPDENLFTDAGANFLTSNVQVGDRLVVTDPAAGKTTVLRIVQQVVDATNLRVTSNFGTSGTDINGTAYVGMASSGLDYRIEHVVTDDEVSSSFLVLTGNELVVRGGMTWTGSLTGTSTAAAYIVSYADLYMAYRSLRADLALVTKITTSTLTSTLGRLDERNPLCVGVNCALNNSNGFPVYAYGVLGDDLNGATDTVTAYSTLITALESRKDVYAVTPLTFNETVIGNVLAHCNTFSEPERSRFRIQIAGWGPLATLLTLGSASVTGASESVSGDDPGVFVFDGESLATAGVQAGDHLYLTNEVGGARVLTAGYNISRVYDEERVLTDEGGSLSPTSALSTWYFLRGESGVTLRTPGSASLTAAAQTIDLPAGTGSADDVGRLVRLSAHGDAANENLSALGNEDYLILAVATDTYTLELVDGATGWGATDTATVTIVDTVDSSITQTTVANRAPFRRLLDPNATFVTNGVVATDTLEVPIPAVGAGTDFTTVYSGTITSVDSEQRVTLVAGEDIPTTTPTIAQTDIGYRIRRTLNLEGQKDNLKLTVDGAGSYQETRLVLCWPDEVLLSDVTNAKTGSRSRQSGYYIAACVAGMVAGEKPHQGFTRKALRGVDTIYHSSGYYTDDQITELSNAGFLLVAQETPSSTPYILHQLTTDSSSTIQAELSVRKTLDYVSIVLRDVLDAFIGEYNIDETTLEILLENINTTLDTLKAARSPKIGAPIKSAEVTHIGVLDGTDDRVEVYVLLDLPKPLNRIGIHLVSS